MRKQNPELLLFDLGGVLVEFSGFRDLCAFLREPLSESEIKQKWLACPTMREFEIGRLAARPFAERFVQEWEVHLTAAEFFKEFRSWARDLLPGARELLAELRGRFRLACLSNSNETYWSQSAQEHGLLDLFEAGFSSHQLGLRKPDPMIFQRTLSALRVKPEVVVFFDDSAANVSAARELGIEAFQVAGVTELRACLIKLGFL
jgi:putative hydrolase of the HAD superfamily